MIGQTISHYKISEKLGEGGMGVVYKAEDTKLERTVALKFLASHLLNDEEAKTRFLREAKAAAALNHPNICTVYEIDDANSKTFLAMEFVEGETLEDKIARGPLAIKEALEIGQQIAKGLQAAHEKAIVHRDIKPANVLVATEGQVTIMDFGLARLTEASRLTKVDTAMGTVAYMSPEQAQGMEVDHRSDVWSLGCVLYEMVAGQRTFKGQYDQALLYEIVNQEPEPLTAVRAGVPMELEFIVGKCLAKDRDDRHGSAHEVARDLRTLSEKLKSGRSTILRTPHLTGAVSATMTAGQTASPAPLLPPDAVVMPKSRQRLMQALLGATTVALVALAAMHFTQAPPPSVPTVEFSLAPPAGAQPVNLSLSPDGRYLVLSVQSTKPGPLWLRALDSDEWRELQGTAGASYPFWSPDSTQIGFFADGRLKKITAAGGPPQTITEASDGRGGSWGKDGTIVFAPTPFGRIQRVSESGGEPTPVIEATEGVPALRRFPQLLPDGLHFLYAEGPPQPGIYLGSLDGGTARRLLADQSNQQYVPSMPGTGQGFLLFIREGVLVAQPFDVARLELAGGAIALPVNPAGTGNVGNFGFAASTTGLLAYTSFATFGPMRLVWVDRTGTVVERTDLVAQYLVSGRLSPDGTRVAFVSMEAANVDVWVYDLRRGTRTRLTDAPGSDYLPVWSPDGRQVVFGSQDSSRLAMLALRSADGSGSIVNLAAQNVNLAPSDWSVDGRFLLYTWQDPVTADDIWSLERTGTGNEGWTPRLFSAAPSSEHSPRLSPNGRYVAYVSDESGRFQVYVQPFPEGGQRTTVSTEGGLGPVWSRDGTELFYVTPGDELVAARVSTEGEFSVKDSTTLFQRAGMRNRTNANYDVSSDGRRFLLLELVDGDTSTPESTIRIIQNWPAKYLPQH